MATNDNDPTNRSEYGTAHGPNISAESFAAATPDVPAERYECDSCGRKLIGDPEPEGCFYCRDDENGGEDE